MTTPAPAPSSSTSTPAISRTTLGYIVQLGGIAAFTVGAALSLHHLPIGISFLGGAVAFYVGKKIRTLS
jgi:hypothetical protein